MYQHHNPYQASAYATSYNGSGYHQHTPYYPHHYHHQSHPSFHQNPTATTNDSCVPQTSAAGGEHQQQQHLGQQNPASNALGQLLQFQSWNNPPIKTEKDSAPDSSLADYHHPQNQQQQQQHSSLEYHRKCLNDFAQAQQRLREQCEGENRYQNPGSWNFAQGQQAAGNGGKREQDEGDQLLPTEDILSLTNLVAKEADEFYEKKKRLGEKKREGAESDYRSCSSKSAEQLESSSSSSCGRVPQSGGVDFASGGTSDDAGSRSSSSNSSSNCQIQIPEVEMEFAVADLALATVPGMNFDPKSRSFSVDELKPQPIIKKRGKVINNRSS